MATVQVQSQQCGPLGGSGTVLRSLGGLQQPLHHGPGQVQRLHVPAAVNDGGHSNNGVAAQAPLGILGKVRQVIELKGVSAVADGLVDDGTAGEHCERQSQQQSKSSSHGVSSSRWARGQRTVNTAPPPGRLAASTVPPRRSTVSRTMDKPRPVPPAARERALSTR